MSTNHFNGNGRHFNTPNGNGIHTPTTGTVPENTYRRHVLRARNTDDYFTFDRKLVKCGLFKKLEALFLQDLINLASMPHTIRDREDYFLCTVAFLENSLDWDKDTQHQMLKRLLSLEVIRVKKIGSPPRRWVWIDILKIEQAIDDWLGEAQSSVNTDDRSSVFTDTNKVIPNGITQVQANCGPQARSVGEILLSKLIDPTHEEPPASRFARRLLGILNKYKKLEGRKPPHLPTWERQFGELLKIRSTAQIDKLLDWFGKYLPDRYTPKVRSAGSFLERITDLEDARDRVEKPRNTPAQDDMPPDYMW